MTVLTRIGHFYQHTLTRSDKILMSLILLTALLACIYVSINHWVTHFSGYYYTPCSFVRMSPAMLVVLLAACHWRKLMPTRVFSFTIAYTYLFFILLVLSWAETGQQFTPFPTIDRRLLYADWWLGFNTQTVLRWVAHHPILKDILNWAYNTLVFQIFAVVLFLGLSGKVTHIYRLFNIVLITFIMGSIIYYFFPTTAPASVIASPHFLEESRLTGEKFYWVHHFFPVVSYRGGMIAFPSFHVIWAVLLCMAVYFNKWVFYPLCVLNSLLISATILLGWHYLVDVMASFVIVVVGIGLNYYLFSFKS